MSQKYSGGFITKSPVAPTTSAASGIWTLDQQQQAQQAGNWPSPPMFIEDLFSTYLYTGNGSTQTITNNIDLSTNGGLVWIRRRGSATDHHLEDTVRGATKYLISNTTNAEQTNANAITAFNSTGFSLGSMGDVNSNNGSFVSWTFREQPKFFDVVTYSGNSTAGREISHNLGSAPGMIIVKSTSASGSWWVFHRSLGATQRIALEDTAAAATNINPWYNTTPTSTVFTLSAGGAGNDTGTDYVAYLFAHDAGGFPVSGGGSTNGISCGSFTTDGSGNATVSLGYEPQWLMFKASSGVGSWFMYDNMRGFGVTSASNNYLLANTSGAENNGGSIPLVTSTGFSVTAAASTTYIYIAIRRGPMKTPTVGTSVFTPILTGSSASNLTDTYSSIGFPIDMTLRYQTGTDTSGTLKNAVYTRLMGINSGATDTPVSANNPNLLTHSTAAQDTTYYLSQDGSMGMNYGGSWSAPAYVLTHLHFKRAPGYMDVVCYTGNGSTQNVTHNLGVAPELMIIKSRNTTQSWTTYSLPTGNENYGVLNTTVAWVSGGSFTWNNTTPTNTVFSLGSSGALNGSGDTYVAYLFATCAGVSKVGSYTGTGTTQTINCGFTAGSRFVMIKRTDSTGDWYVWDSARGIVAGNDPYLLLNSTAAEVTSTDYIDTSNAGFEISSTAPAAINASAGTFIFLAIA